MSEPTKSRHCGADTTISFPFELEDYRELEAQAETLGLSAEEWARKVLTSGVKAGRDKGWKPQQDWRFVVASGGKVFSTVNEAEQAAAELAESRQTTVLIVPTDATFLASAMQARYQGVIIEEAKL